MNILLVEDDKGISEALAEALRATYKVTLAGTGSEALLALTMSNFDAVALDLQLPDMHGLDICRRLRSEGNRVPILVLTGESKIMSKINLLDAGADDYLTKPFSLGELKARLRALVRRAHENRLPSLQLATDDLTLDAEKFQVQRAGQTIKLRRKEFALLECLMQHAGGVVTRDTLSTHAWRGSEEPWTNTIDVHIKYLRDKIDRPFGRPLIRTVHGLGYKLEVPRVVAKNI